jgi:hypothetical protein
VRARVALAFTLGSNNGNSHFHLYFLGGAMVDENSQFCEDFFPGCLVYGENKQRQQYISALTRKFSKSSQKVVATIDKLIPYQFEQYLKGKRSDLPESSSDDVGDLKDAVEYYKLATEYIDHIKSGTGNYGDKIKHKDKPGRIGTAGRTLQTERFLTAKCKAGIEFVLLKGYRIMFVLDGLDVARCLEKREADGVPKDQQVWYTASELRYLKKKWGTTVTADNVLFYLSGQRVSAPWL